MRTIIQLHLNGENQQQQLMTVIQYVVPSKSKPLKKLALMFWEIVEKTGKDGKLLPELILVWYVAIVVIYIYIYIHIFKWGLIDLDIHVFVNLPPLSTTNREHQLSSQKLFGASKRIHSREHTAFHLQSQSY